MSVDLESSSSLLGNRIMFHSKTWWFLLMPAEKVILGKKPKLGHNWGINAPKMTNFPDFTGKLKIEVAGFETVLVDKPG